MSDPTASQPLEVSSFGGPEKLQVRFSSAGLHIYTQNRLGHTTWFGYHAGTRRLASITLPVVSGSAPWYSFNYDGNGVLYVATLYSSEPARSTQLARNGFQIANHSDPDGRIVHYGYGSGVSVYRIENRINRLGYVTYYSYNPFNRVSGSTLNMADGTYIYRYTTPVETQATGSAMLVDSVYSVIDGPRTDVADVTRFWHNAYGGISKIKDAVGGVTTIGYDANWPGSASSVVRPGGFTTTASFDASTSNMTSSTAINPRNDGYNATTSYQWDPTWHNVTKVTHPEGNEENFYYDPATGNLLWDQPGTDPSRRRHYYYGATGQLRLVTDAMGYRDSIGYDGLGNVSENVTHLGFVARFRKDGLGRDTQITRPIAADTNQTTRIVYDAMDRVIKSITSGPARAYSLPLSGYAPDPEPIQAMSKTDSTTYDAEGQVIAITSWPSPSSGVLIAEAMKYDGAGRLRKRLLGSGPDSMVYDPAGNLVNAQYRSGSWVSQTFDAANRLTQRVVPGRIHSQSRCGPLLPAGPITGHPDHLCFVTFPYYPNHLTNLRFSINTSTFVYDGAGHMSQANNYYARIRRTYFNNGSLKTDTTVLGDYNSPWIDADYRGQRYEYDLNGRRSKMHWYYGTTHYAYHPHGPLSQITDPRGTEYKAFYLPNGWLDSLQLGTATSETRLYDEDGRMWRRRRKSPLKFDLALDYLNYDRSGRVISGNVYYYGDVTEDFRVHYDAMGAVMVNERYRSAHPSAILEEFRSDALGNTTWNRQRSWAGGNDAPFRTIFSENGGLSYRAAELSYPPGQNQREDILDQYLGAGGELNLQSHLVRTPDGPVNQQVVAKQFHGSDDVLMAIQRYSYRGSAVGDGTWEEYWYDALGRRILTRARRDLVEKPANSVYLCQGMTVCRSFWERVWWDGDQPLLEIRTPQYTSDVSNSGVVGNIHMLEIDEPLAVLGEYTWIITYDWRGLAVNSIQPNGAVGPGEMDWPHTSQSGTFYTPSPSSGGGSSNPKRWLGTFVNNGQGTSTHLYRRNRFFSPATGQFTQQDPIGLSGGMNLFGFAAGDPITYSDPFGLEACTKEELEAGRETQSSKGGNVCVDRRNRDAQACVARAAHLLAVGFMDAGTMAGSFGVARAATALAGRTLESLMASALNVGANAAARGVLVASDALVARSGALGAASARGAPGGAAMGAAESGGVDLRGLLESLVPIKGTDVRWNAAVRACDGTK